jgi:SAM-dependent methyltransferase
VVLSNCVMNLSPDKPAVLAEAHRVLRPGGRLAIADLATRGELPLAMRQGLAAWSACFAGALEVDELQALLIAAGFEDAGVEITRTFGPADLDLLPATLLAELGIENLPVDQLAAAASRVVSVFLRGRKAAP